MSLALLTIIEQYKLLRVIPVKLKELGRPGVHKTLNGNNAGSST